MQYYNDQHLHHAVISAPVGICILDAATLKSEIVNDKFLEVAGKPYEAIYDKFYWEPFAEARVYYEDALNSVVLTGETFYANEVELMLIRYGKAQTVFVTFVYSPIKNTEGVVSKVAVWVLENTLQVTARRKIEQANEQLRASQAQIVALNDKLAGSNKALAASNAETTAINEQLIRTNRELKQTAEELKVSRNDLVFTIQAAGLATFDFNPANKRFNGNDLLKSWFSLQNQEYIELQLAIDVIADFDRERVIGAIDAALDRRSDGKYDIEYSIREPDSPKFRVVHAKGETLFDERGIALRLSGTLQDITKQKEDEQRKNDFIGMVSHELKTPLTSLTALIQLTSSKLKNSSDTFLATAMAKANLQVKRMTTMINGFLNISRLESSSLLIEKKLFNLDELVNDIIRETEMTVSTHQFTFLPCEPVLVYADADKIGSVISNLTSNAVKYSPAGNNVEIKCAVIGDKAQFSIKDEGMGIKPEDRDKLFERYYRVENVQTRHIAGFGIGLYLSAEIIKRHNGDIWVESGPGQGSVFYFSLPVVEG